MWALWCYSSVIQPCSALCALISPACDAYFTIIDLIQEVFNAPEHLFSPAFSFITTSSAALKQNPAEVSDKEPVSSRTETAQAVIYFTHFVLMSFINRRKYTVQNSHFSQGFKYYIQTKKDFWFCFEPDILNESRLCWITKLVSLKWSLFQEVQLSYFIDICFNYIWVWIF